MMEGSSKHFRSNGKLMLSGEYVVLYGALALAVPTLPGQALEVKKVDGSTSLRWKTLVESKPWLDCRIDPDGWSLSLEDPPEKAAMLVQLLKAASEIRGDTEWLMGNEVLAELEFNIEWGLGSSSSLISNIAWWAGIDPFQLAGAVSRGSGYDIACARSDKPLLYRTGQSPPGYTPIDFRPSFHEQLAFVYLGRKQDSAASVRNFLSHAQLTERDIAAVTTITEKLCQADRLDVFEKLLREHEAILSGILGKPPVKRALFDEYPGEVKSLGAWGGDFIMITMHQDWSIVKAYFSAKGMETVISYRDMVKI
jgi:mevalonate kinase